MGAFASWRILGSSCCCFLPVAAVVVTLMLSGAGAGALPGVYAFVLFLPLIFEFWYGLLGGVPSPRIK